MLPDWWIRQFGNEPYFIQNCIEGLKKLPDDCIDMVLTDPPHNIDLQYKSYKDNLTETEYENLLSNVLIELNRIVKNGPVIIFFRDNCHVMFHAIEKTSLKFRLFLYWYYPNNQRRTSFKLFNRITSAFVLSKNTLRPDPKILYENVLQYDSLSPNKSEVPNGAHPCPMPHELYRQIIKGFSKQGDIVLDPFLGAGTTLAACKASRRIGVGFEICPEYKTIIEDRINNIKVTIPVTEFE